MNIFRNSLLFISAIMGRYYWDKKTEKDALDSISMAWLKKHDYLCGYKTGGIKWKRGYNHESSVSFTVCVMDDEKYINFRYSVTNREGIKADYDYSVSIVSTPCNYGGLRYWFICPLSRNGYYCGKRVAELFIDGKYFGCRHCYNLTYSSRNVNRRSPYYPIFRSLDLRNKIDELQTKMKREFYRGKLTRKARRLEKMGWECVDYIPFLEKELYN